MFTFLLSVIPLFSFCALTWSGPRFNYKKDILHVLFGMLAGILYSAVGAAFFRAYRLAEYSFLSNWGYFLCTRTLFPVIYLCVLFILLSKGTIRERLYSLPLYVSGFFMVFVPYQTIHMNESFDFFLLYVFPLVTVCFLVLIWYACTLFSEEKGVVFVLAAAVLILALLLPSIIYTLYFINGAIWLRIILGVLFAGISGYAAVLSFPHKV